jgi:uncharacterized membrane protein
MNRAERWTSCVLLVGGVLGVVLMVLGVLGSALWTERGLPGLVAERAHAVAPRAHAEGVGVLQCGAPCAADTIVSIRQIGAALSHRPIDPLGFAALGIVALFVTPLAAVVTAGVAFYLEGDGRFVTVSAVVAATLLLSLWLGGGA